MWGVLSTLARNIALWFLVLAVVGCASPIPRQLHTFSAAEHWSGRLSVNVYGPQPQSMTADFELDGNPESGQLLLSTPLGSTLAELRWNPTQASLVAQGATTPYASLAAMVSAVSGTELPVAQLFDWLKGMPTAHPEWTVDLSQSANGKIFAKRARGTAEAADVKVILSP